MAKRNMVIACAIVLLCAQNAPRADQVVFEQGLNGYAGTGDTTIYDSNNEVFQNSNGGGASLFAGRIRTGQLRRALVKFDLSSIPAGSQITAASFQMRAVQSNAASSNHSLHRITTDWQPGTVNATLNPGQGAPAQPGDATWIFSSFNTIRWTSSGGDFVSAASASAVASVGATVVWSDAQLTQDVQDWVDGTAPNFGWILIGNEITNQTAFRFNSSEGGSVGTRPRLTVDYNPPVAPTVQSNQSEFVAFIEGSQVPTASNAVGAGRFTIDTDANTFDYDIRWGGIPTNEIAAHIHGPADPGMDALVKHTLPAGRVKIGTWNYDEADEADILSGRMYVNVHSNSFPQGEIRGQIVNFVSFIDGPQAATTSTASGIGLFLINTDDNKLGYHVLYNLDGTESNAHIHGATLHTEPGSVLHPLPSTNPKTGVWDYPENNEADILNGRTWVNIHSNLAPGGEIRGQITRFVTAIDGDQAGVDTPAIGTGFFSWDGANDRLGYHVIFSGLSSNENNAHIHGPASPGMGAGVLHPLPAGSPKLGIWDYDPVNEPAIQFSRTYVNIHSENNLAGEIRGQVWIEPLPPAAARDNWLLYR